MEKDQAKRIKKVLKKVSAAHQGQVCQLFAMMNLADQKIELNKINCADLWDLIADNVEESWKDI